MKYWDKQSLPYTLAIYRILFGVVLSVFFIKSYITGVVQWVFLDDRIHLHYPFLPNISHLSELQLRVAFIVLIVASVCFTFGLFYRLATLICLVIFSYFLLLEVSFYNNHYYLSILLYLLFLITDANKVFSLDSLLFKNKFGNALSIKKWQIDIFKFQIFIVYFYGGLSKLMNHDWMNNRVMSELLSILLTDASQMKIELVSNFMTFGGLLYDLGIIFLLIQKKLKWKLLGLVMVLSFNTINHFLFDIGIFPFIMLGATILFFDTETNKWFAQKLNVKHSNNKHQTKQQLVATFLAVYIVFQLLFPVRHLLIKGNVFYTGEGYFFSWHMMFGIVDGGASFKVVDNTNGVTYIINPHDYLSSKQNTTLLSYPILAIQMADFIEQKVKLWGCDDMEIYGNLDIIRNGRAIVPQINPELNILNEKAYMLKHNDWINLNEFN